MILFPKRRGQMSDSMVTALFIILSGGLQDAYTYVCRGKVFANAQTGNIVLLSTTLFEGDWSHTLHYLAPVLSFLLGIFIAECVHRRFKHIERVHWRQMILLAEIILLIAVGFLPQSLNTTANAVVSFVCAMQVEAFRKMKGSAYASTMCIGNLRSATEMLYRYRHTKEKGCLEKCLRYYGVILVFGIGAALGSFMTSLFEERTIWISCGFLFVCFCIMFIKEDIEGERGLD